jgi:hypothetical protein
MNTYKTQQHHLVHRGHSFHFVSYEGQPADEKRHQPEMLPSWYLMLAGKRWMQVELDRQFGEWLDGHVLSSAPAVQSQQPPSAGAATLTGPAEALLAAIPSAGARGTGGIM